MSRERCVVPRCREPVALEVLGKLYCAKHNAERLDMDARIEADIREVLEPEPRSVLDIDDGRSSE